MAGYPQPIVLVGLMGSGKTTIGRALAERLGFRFLDNDAGIEAEYDATGRELADRLGVEALHRIEVEQLAHALDSFGSEPVVIAAAASVVDDAAGRSQLAPHTVVWLHAGAAYLADRVLDSDHRRHLGPSPRDQLVAQSSARRNHFEDVSDIKVLVEGRSVHDIVEGILRQFAPLPRLYTDLAGWFHLLTDPADYAEEAAFYLTALREAAARPIETILELGSGGGNNASHMKQHASLTLVDISPEMLELSGSINPECEHITGDMRSVRLERRFDAVFIHDAIDYLTTLEDVRAAIETAVLHLQPGGVLLVAPDHVAETFQPSTSTGGHGDGHRALAYEENTWDPDPSDTTYVADYTYRLTEAGSEDRVIEERHELGVFSRSVWLDALRATGLTASVVPFSHSEVDYILDVFVARAPSDVGAA
ncbi:MAG: methyltransferase domain-containing protein [Acidimicrobiia bacterium]|nr:methyltransferase domain-containing protein [Acidimicrobiia bacterium]